jgi:hypothetical protein
MVFNGSDNVEAIEFATKKQCKAAKVWIETLSKETAQYSPGRDRFYAKCFYNRIYDARK